MVGAWVDSQGALFWRKLTLPPQEIINSSSRRKQISWLLLHPFWIFTGFIMCRSQAYSLSQCEFMCAMSLSWQTNTVSLQYMLLWLLQSFHPSSAMISEPPVEGIWYQCPHGELSKPQSLALYVLTNYGYWLPYPTKRRLFLWWKRGNILHGP